MNLALVEEKFSSEEACLLYLEQLRWSNKPQCPYCASFKCTHTKGRIRYHCNRCYTTFGVLVKTIFHQTHLPLKKWFAAIICISSAPDISIRNLAGYIGVNKTTAHRMITIVRDAIQYRNEFFIKLYNSLIYDVFNGLDRSENEK